MKTDHDPIEGDFIPDYIGWENDFDERCRRPGKITVSLQSHDLPAGIEKAIQERATKNGWVLVLNHADKRPSVLIFNKAAD